MSESQTITPAPSLQLLSDGDLVRAVLSDDYEILEEIGRGGMAIVYRAREKALDREVAIKVLPARLAIDVGFVERFEHEARTAAKLEHPNIVPIYRVGRAGPNGEVSYFVMKLLRGQSLSAVLADRGKLEPGDVRRILMETGSALGYAARFGVVHRDIKPDNIMLDSEGRCVVTDFGIAKAPGGQQTTAGTSLGTPRYMSPEHAIGSSLDGRSDMYSLGIVAYQALTGKPPFTADEPFTVLYKHVHDPLPQPTFTTDEERELFAIIARMLAKNPDDRYQNGNELIAALGGQVSDPSLIMLRSSVGLMAPTEVITTPKPWSVQRWRHFTRTEKRLIILLTVSVALLVLSFKIDRGGSPGGPDRAEPRGAPLKSVSRASTDTNQPQRNTTTTTPPKTPSAPRPSARAAAIIAYNKLASNCPARDTVAASKPIEFAIMMDTILDRRYSDKMDVSYDVCGVAKGSPFTVRFSLNKLRQLPIRPQPAKNEILPPKISTGPRSRERHRLDVSEMSPGDYRLDIFVTNMQNKQVQVSREFKISDK